MREADLAPPLLAYLEPQHWDVYQEVEGAGGRCDVVAVKDGVVWVLELKTSLSLTLLDQVVRRLPYAHFVSVVVPQAKKPRRYHSPGLSLLRHLGAGLFELRTRTYNGQSYLSEVLRPVQHTAALVGSLLAGLNPGQKRCAGAGSTHGGQWTPFKDSCDAVLRWVVDHQGSSIRELLDGVGKLHYKSLSSARAALLKRIEQGVVPAVWKSSNGQLWHAPIGKPLARSSFSHWPAEL